MFGSRQVVRHPALAGHSWVKERVNGIQMNYVYILKSKKDDRLYIGQTQDLKERLERHEKGWVTSTRNRRPLVLIHSEEYKSRSEAVRRESYLKKLKGGEGFKKIIGYKTQDN